ncbi:MAG: hypothetical protein P8L32_06520 [Paracoccaceae bacterium]|nr:hypothetical protein [Paracoccaceae bacterium]
MSDKVLMTVEVAAARRYIALFIVGLLGALLLFLGFSVQGDFFGRVFLVISGVFCLWGMMRMYAATGTVLELTETELRQGDGEVLAMMDDIKKIERGVFAFKPSNGFIVVLKTSKQRAWRPGLWWRLGKRVGVGGITNAGQNKAMSEFLMVALNNRDN